MSRLLVNVEDSRRLTRPRASSVPLMLVLFAIELGEYEAPLELDQAGNVHGFAPDLTTDLGRQKREYVELHE